MSPKIRSKGFQTKLAKDFHNLKKSHSVLPTKQGYDRWASIYDSDGNPLIALEEPVIKRLLGDVKGLKVVDVGCGTGRHALKLAEEGAEVIAADFSEGMIQTAQKKARAGSVQFVNHDVTKPLPFSDSMFDRVLCCLVLEHIQNLEPFFRELGRICRKEGYIVISAMHPAMWLKGQSARFTDPESGKELRPRSYPQQISDYVMHAMRSGLLVDYMSEHAPDDKLARKFPRAQKHIGWPMLLVMRLRWPDAPYRDAVRGQAPLWKDVSGGAQVATFVVKDLKQARKFYVDRLGLTIDREEQGRYVMVHAGSLLLCIDLEDSENKARGGGASVLFHANNLDRIAKGLDGRGVAYERHSRNRGNGYIEVRDPEGYKLIFAEKL